MYRIIVLESNSSVWSVLLRGFHAHVRQLLIHKARRGTCMNYYWIRELLD